MMNSTKIIFVILRIYIWSEFLAWLALGFFLILVELKLENKIALFNDRLKKCKREKHFRRKKNYEFEQRRIRFRHFGQKGKW